MVLASYVPVAALLAEHGCRVLIVSTSSPKYSTNFAKGLGFELPGTIVVDTKRHTHRAAKLKASVFASLVMPFKKHLRTFGTKAIAEALRVSLLNATAGHGSSWQQGATFILKKDAADVRCAYAWREDFPGDWQPIHTVLDEALGIKDAPVVSFPERLDFVIACRNGKQGAAVADGSTSSTTSGKKRPLPAAGCGEEACSIDAVRQRSVAAMAPTTGA